MRGKRQFKSIMLWNVVDSGRSRIFASCKQSLMTPWQLPFLPDSQGNLSNLFQWLQASFLKHLKLESHEAAADVSRLRRGNRVSHIGSTSPSLGCGVWHVLVLVIQVAAQVLRIPEFLMQGDTLCAEGAWAVADVMCVYTFYEFSHMLKCTKPSWSYFTGL